MLLLFGLPIAAGAFNIYVIFEGMQQRDMGGMWWFLLPSIILFIGAFALAVELSLSLVRNLKNRSFVQHSFILRACRWCWRTVKRLWFWLADLLRRGWHAIGRGGNSVWRKILKNYKTRNVLLIFLGYSVILSLLAMMFGLMIDYGEGVLVFILGVVWFAAAAWFLLSRINGFECVVEALRRLRGGELEYKLENMPAGVFSETGGGYQLPGRRDADRAAERDPRGTDEERADYECQP